MLIDGQSDNSRHDLFVSCEVAVLVFLLVFDLRDLHNALEKSEQDLAGSFAAIDTDLSNKLGDSNAKFLIELEVN